VRDSAHRKASEIATAGVCAVSAWLNHFFETVFCPFPFLFEDGFGCLFQLQALDDVAGALADLAEKVSVASAAAEIDTTRKATTTHGGGGTAVLPPTAHVSDRKKKSLSLSLAANNGANAMQLAASASATATDREASTGDVDGDGTARANISPPTRRARASSARHWYIRLLNSRGRGGGGGAVVDQRGHSRREMLVQRGEWYRAEKIVNNNEGRRSYSRFSSCWSWSPLETAATHGHAGVVQVGGVVHVLSVMVLVQVP
jgi:hypothetical protein